jgi:hypothetical protein
VEVVGAAGQPPGDGLHFRRGGGWLVQG